MIGSRSTSASSIAASSCAGASAKPVRRLPSGVFGPNFSRTALISSATFFHCSFSEPMRFFTVVRSARNSLSSLRISISSSLRKLRSRMFRMASACSSVSLKVFTSTGLGSSSLRMILMILSRFRYATRRPPNTSSRFSIWRRRKFARRTSTSRRCASHSVSASARPVISSSQSFSAFQRGEPPRCGTMMTFLKRSSSSSLRLGAS